MRVSPFTYFRGAALPMAADLAVTPTSGFEVQLCGDAHLSNFGVFGTPERHLVFSLNDFDETHPGPWEWDVKRLAASLEIAGRENAFEQHERRRIVEDAVRRARGHVALVRRLDRLARRARRRLARASRGAAPLAVGRAGIAGAFAVVVPVALTAVGIVLSGGLLVALTRNRRAAVSAGGRDLAGVVRRALPTRRPRRA